MSWEDCLVKGRCGFKCIGDETQWCDIGVCGVSGVALDVVWGRLVWSIVSGMGCKLVWQWCGVKDNVWELS